MRAVQNSRSFPTASSGGVGGGLGGEQETCAGLSDDMLKCFELSICGKRG